ncbi:MAG: FkbM family methyltransferase [Planctomycetaceae bacterium]
MNTTALIDRILSSAEFAERPPVLVDVGASGGMHAPWRPIARHSICIGFDPDDRDFSTATGNRGFRECHVVRAIVTDRDSPECVVHLTKSPYCSSTLRPRGEALAAYTHAGLFDVVGSATVPSTRLDTVLEAKGLDRVDWLKTDSQGLDRRVFESLSPAERKRAIVVELEPGILDGYEGEDKLEDVLEAFSTRDFWCASLVAKGAVRGSAAVVARYLGEAMLPSLPVTERTGAGWAEIEYINTFADPSLHTVRDLLLGWVFASLRGHHVFALQLADMGGRLFSRDPRFPGMADHSARGIVGRHRTGLIGRGMRKLRRLMFGHPRM